MEYNRVVLYPFESFCIILGCVASKGGTSHERTCTPKITNLPIQVNISENLYFLWNCNNMYTFLILDKDRCLTCSLRVTERGKCGHSILIMCMPYK